MDRAAEEARRTSNPVVNIYIAAPSECRLEGRMVRTALQAVGHAVTARWLDTTTEYGAAAVRDLQDIDAADALLQLAYLTPVMGARGQFVELGYALGRGKRVMVLGGPITVFHHHPKVERYVELQDILEAL